MGVCHAPQIGNVQAVAQFLSNLTKSVSGTVGDLLSPARMVIFGTLLTTLNKPMFAASGWVYGTYGTIACAYWVTSAKVRNCGRAVLVPSVVPHAGFPFFLWHIAAVVYRSTCAKLFLVAQRRCWTSRSS